MREETHREIFSLEVFQVVQERFEAIQRIFLVIVVFGQDEEDERAFERFFGFERFGLFGEDFVEFVISLKDLVSFLAYGAWTDREG